MSQGFHRITFANDGPWFACSQREMALWATDTDKGPLWLRVMFAAFGNLMPTGHAPFSIGELPRILGKVDTSTGRVAEARPDSVSKALGEARRRGLISPGSTARCIVLPNHAFQKGTKGRPPCRVHRLDRLA